jgi:hypothetical protein
MRVREEGFSPGLFLPDKKEIHRPDDRSFHGFVDHNRESPVLADEVLTKAGF